MTQFKILVVDDQFGRAGLDRESFLDRVQRDESEFLFTTGQTEDGCNAPQVTLDIVEQLWERPGEKRLSLILLDVRFPDPLDVNADRFGFTLLRALRKKFGSDLPIVMLTGEAGVKGTAIATEVTGFLPKEELCKNTLDEQVFRNGLFPDASESLIGSAPAFLLTLRGLRRVVRSGVMELLLLGETGTGKSDLAKFVHSISGRSKGPFVTWFGRRVESDLHNDQLFGHWWGAFTGAGESVPGVAEKAHRGTLFIDEIAELSPSVQVDLLEYRLRGKEDNLRRVKRQGHYPKRAHGSLNLVGEYSEKEDRVLVDTFLITATNRPIEDSAWREREGFRLDLFNRLGHRITVPPLRERVEDIAPLFLALWRRAIGREIELAPDAQALLEAHEWREGNVEEVRQIASSLSALIGPEFDKIHAHHFDGILGRSSQPQNEPQSSTEGTETTTLRIDDSGKQREIALPRRLVDFEVHCMWGVTERLRAAVFETRRPSGLGTLADIFSHATGVAYSATDVKREVKEILAPWFSPSERKVARWKQNPRYQNLVERVRSDVVLCALYEYSIGRIDWRDAKTSINSTLNDQNTSRSPS